MLNQCPETPVSISHIFLIVIVCNGYDIFFPSYYDIVSFPDMGKFE